MTTFGGQGLPGLSLRTSVSLEGNSGFLRTPSGQPLEPVTGPPLLKLQSTRQNGTAASLTVVVNRTPTRIQRISQHDSSCGIQKVGA